MHEKRINDLRSLVAIARERIEGKDWSPDFWADVVDGLEEAVKALKPEMTWDGPIVIPRK